MSRRFVLVRFCAYRLTDGKAKKGIWILAPHFKVVVKVTFELEDQVEGTKVS